MAAQDALDREFQYYLAHREQLAERYQGRYLAIKDGNVLGDYVTVTEAVRETAKTYRLGTFLVQLCDLDPASTTSTFHSRVSPT